LLRVSFIITELLLHNDGPQKHLSVFQEFSQSCDCTEIEGEKLAETMVKISGKLIGEAMAQMKMVTSSIINISANKT